MFTNLAPAPGSSVPVMFEGRPLELRAGITLAAALLEAGVGTFRATPVSGSPRAPFCMMGVCCECLLNIDGVANRQACMVKVREGMVIKRQSGAAAPSGDEAPE